MEHKRRITIYLVTTFLITGVSWGILSIIKQDDDQIFNNPLFFLLFFIGGIAPTVAPYLSISLSDRQFKSFNQSVLKWRINFKFYLIILLLVLGIPSLAITIYEYFNEPVWVDLSPDFFALIPLTIIMIPFGGLEELGWRGFLLPELSKKINFQISSLIVGLIWALWHIPLFFIQGLHHYQSNFLSFLIQVVGLGLALAWLFGRTKSVFICVLFHAFYNASSSIGLNYSDEVSYITGFIWLGIGIFLILYDRRNLKINGG